MVCCLQILCLHKGAYRSRCPAVNALLLQNKMAHIEDNILELLGVNTGVSVKQSRAVYDLSSEVPEMDYAIIAACCKDFRTSRESHTIDAAAQGPFICCWKCPQHFVVVLVNYQNSSIPGANVDDVVFVPLDSPATAYRLQGQEGLLSSYHLENHTTVPSLACNCWGV